MMSDVPLGSFLSGGIDSGMVTALAAEARREEDGPALETFTIGFPGDGDERAMAAAVAARHGTSHQDQEDSHDYLALAAEQVRIFGEPFADISAVPTLAVCRLARRHVTVALSGDGGDEVFAGYRRHRWHSIIEAVRRLLPSGVRTRVIGRLADAYPHLSRAPRWLRARSTLTELSLDSALGYYSTVCKLADQERRALFAPRMRAALDGHDPAARFRQAMDRCDPRDPLFQAQYTDLCTYLPGNILVKVDRASMAVSLEVRPPLLDPGLVEWGLGLAAGLKLRAGRGKAVLREAATGLLPDSVLRGRKQGFAASIGGQFRRGANSLRGLLLQGPMADCGLFQRDALARMVAEHEVGARDHAQSLWALAIIAAFLAQREASGPVLEAFAARGG
jgi:asparagine synthase (glutamine-hydrolysing)